MFIAATFPPRLHRFTACLPPVMKPVCRGLVDGDEPPTGNSIPAFRGWYNLHREPTSLSYSLNSVTWNKHNTQLRVCCLSFLKVTFFILLSNVSSFYPSVEVSSLSFYPFLFSSFLPLSHSFLPSCPPCQWLPLSFPLPCFNFLHSLHVCPFCFCFMVLLPSCLLLPLFPRIESFLHYSFTSTG